MRCLENDLHQMPSFRTSQHGRDPESSVAFLIPAYAGMTVCVTRESRSDHHISSIMVLVRFAMLATKGNALGATPERKEDWC